MVIIKLLKPGCNISEEIDSVMTYISTDYIFDGTGTRPWTPEDENFAPLNFYGQTKLEGELAVKKILEKLVVLTQLH